MSANPKENLARRNDMEQASHTYHNCKIINIVTPHKKVPKDVIELLSNLSDEGPEDEAAKSTEGSDNSEAKFEKALGELDVDEIATNYWRKKSTTTVTNVNITSSQKRYHVKNPYLKK